MAAHGKEDSTPELQRELEGRCDRFEFGEVLSALDQPEVGGADGGTLSKARRLRAREWLSRSMIAVEAPGWQGATKAHTARM